MPARYGSDLVVDLLKILGIEYVALNPGSSFRGIHDSLVNYESGRTPNPEMILCCHEEIAVAVAHGYAKATGKIMPAIVHNVVGLQHASMAIYNAWCDHTPVMVMGGTGPMNTSKRRPWIDWIHTAQVQGNLVRDFVKWDDQPVGVEALDPLAELQKAKLALDAQGAKVRVLLTAMPRGDALRLIDQVPGFQVLVVGKPFDQGETNDPPTPPELIGKTLVVEAPNHLQALGVVVVGRQVVVLRAQECG